MGNRYNPVVDTRKMLEDIDVPDYLIDACTISEDQIVDMFDNEFSGPLFWDKFEPDKNKRLEGKKEFSSQDTASIRYNIGVPATGKTKIAALMRERKQNGNACIISPDLYRQLIINPKLLSTEMVQMFLKKYPEAFNRMTQGFSYKIEELLRELCFENDVSISQEISFGSPECVIELMEEAERRGYYQAADYMVAPRSVCCMSNLDRYFEEKRRYELALLQQQFNPNITLVPPRIYNITNRKLSRPSSIDNSFYNIRSSGYVEGFVDEITVSRRTGKTDIELFLYDSTQMLKGDISRMCDSPEEAMDLGTRLCYEEYKDIIKESLEKYKGIILPNTDAAVILDYWEHIVLPYEEKEYEGKEFDYDLLR